MTNEVIPTILTSDLKDFQKKIKLIKGICKRVQIDIVDNSFSENQTINIDGLRDLGEIGDLQVDLHLMVKDPILWLPRSLQITPERITGQVEKMESPFDFVNEVINSGIQAGLALDLDTPVEKISDDIYFMTDLILILGVKAGKGGQVFDPIVIEKIKKTRSILGEFGNIGIDGGINEDNILQCKEAGANVFFIGNNFWTASDFSEKYQELNNLIK